MQSFCEQAGTLHKENTLHPTTPMQMIRARREEPVLLVTGQTPTFSSVPVTFINSPPVISPCEQWGCFPVYLLTRLEPFCFCMPTTVLITLHPFLLLYRCSYYATGVLIILHPYLLFYTRS